MTRTTLLLAFTFFFSACSDNTSNDLSHQAAHSQKKVVHQQAPVSKTVKSATKLEIKPTSGYAIYVHKCASCHGKNGEKAAFNKAQIIAGWEKEKIIITLNGYKDGSYGGTLKGIMNAQVSALSSAQIEAVSKYIATL